MVAVQIIVPKYDSKTGRPKMVIMGANGDAFEVPWAPRDVSHDGIGENVSMIERAGRVDDLAVKSPKLHTMSFQIQLGRKLNVSIEPDIKRLEAIVNAGGWIQVLYGQRESGLWKCTNFNYTTVEREPIQNQISRAMVDFEFVEVPDSRQTVAKYSSDFNFRDDAATASISSSIAEVARNVRARGTVNVGNPSGATVTSGSISGSNGGATTIAPYIVQAGDTLLTIANKFYGDYGEQFWRLIGDYNKVIGRLNIGQILRIP